VPPALGEIGEQLTQLELRVGDGEGRQSALQVELAREVDALGEGLGEARRAADGTRAHLAQLLSTERTLSNEVASLDYRLRHVNSLADEQGRYLSQVGESLYAQRMVPSKYRSPARTASGIGAGPPLGASGAYTPSTAAQRAGAHDIDSTRRQLS
jgi:hypothetical protein|tara:strand:+ start:333 stop:797 length:465 start_codon:yes stop_codon:yes gene_type:complete